jgi:hypothetical protein
MRRSRLALLCNLRKRAVDLRLVFNETQIMGCTLGPISGPRAEVVLQLHPFIIHPSIQIFKADARVEDLKILKSCGTIFLLLKSCATFKTTGFSKFTV